MSRQHRRTVIIAQYLKLNMGHSGLQAKMKCLSFMSQNHNMVLGMQGCKLVILSKQIPTPTKKKATYSCVHRDPRLNHYKKLIKWPSHLQHCLSSSMILCPCGQCQIQIFPISLFTSFIML